MSGASTGRLRVLVDGEPMEEQAARAFWTRFSAHMDANRGDLRGFAEAEGFASVHPRIDGGRAVLVASREAVQGPYVNAPNVETAANARAGDDPQGDDPQGGNPRGDDDRGDGAGGKLRASNSGARGSSTASRPSKRPRR